MKISRRHKRDGYRARILNRISDIASSEWNKVFPCTLEGYDFLRTLDEVGLEGFTLYYILVYHKKELVGATTCFFVEYSMDTSIAGPIKRIANRIKKIKPDIFSLKAIACGIPMGPGRIGFSGNGEKVRSIILRKIEQLAKKKKASVIAFKDFGHAQTAYLDPLQKEGFTRMESLPTTELNIWFSSFEEYLMSLSGASRYDLRRKFKKVDNRIKIDFEVVDSVDQNTLEEIYALYMQVVKKHDVGFEVMSKEFYRKIQDNMPGKVKYFIWRIDKKVVTFVFCLVSDDFLLDYYIGMDYEIAHKYHLYFVRFRDMLNWCIERGIKKYEMGVTGYDPKKRLGFDFVPLYLYVKLRNRVMRPVFNLICQFLKFENFDPALREVRKKEEKETILEKRVEG